MERSELVQLAKIVAVQYQLIPSIVCGIIEQESSWNPDATRYEPAFYVRYVEPLINNMVVTDMTEAKNRATSWGLMQVMGQVARELGYVGPLPFVDPQVGIRWGCEKFSRCVALGRGDMIAALLHFNGGANKDYPREVIAKSAIYGN